MSESRTLKTLKSVKCQASDDGEWLRMELHDQDGSSIIYEIPSGFAVQWVGMQIDQLEILGKRMLERGEKPNSYPSCTTKPPWVMIDREAPEPIFVLGYGVGTILLQLEREVLQPLLQEAVATWPYGSSQTN